MMKELEQLPIPLLLWYRENARVLPWQIAPTQYSVYISEIMQPQTRVAAVLDYYRRFLEAVPTVADLAALPEDALMKLWQGLGYYSRARNLQKAARILTEQYGGRFPETYRELTALPGIGDYTAGAILSIAFGQAVPAVDGNVLRLAARITGSRLDVLDAKNRKIFRSWMAAAMSQERPGAYNQALMELGALVCVPNGAPLCGQCPLAESCLARAAGTTAQLPQKAKPKPRKIVPVTLALVESPAGFLVQQRPQKGLLAGLWQPVLWEDEHLLQAEVLARLAALGLDTGTAAPAALPAAKHIFTHIEWLMSGVQLHVPAQSAPAGYVWASREQLRTAYALPGAFRAYKPLLL